MMEDQHFDALGVKVGHKLLLAKKIREFREQPLELAQPGPVVEPGPVAPPVVAASVPPEFLPNPTKDLPSPQTMKAKPSPPEKKNKIKYLHLVDQDQVWTGPRTYKMTKESSIRDKVSSF